MKKILIIGATSAIAKETARLYATQGATLYLIARNEEKLSTLENDLKVRGAADVYSEKFEAELFQLHEILIDKAFKILEQVDLVLLAHGSLPDQKACEKNFELTMNELNTNSVGTISLLTHIANKLEKQKSGCVAVITSVAGDRGRPSNYIYGAAKGMVSIFLQGLRARLFKSGSHVVDVKPGFVDTPMTADFDKGMLWSKPKVIAKDIVTAVAKRKNIVYTPYFWKLIMFIIKLIPEFVFKRLNL